MSDGVKLDRKGQGCATQLVGQAGVWAVASKLALLGHFVLFPEIDHGYDIMLETGIRIQVKASRIKYHHPAYPEGIYSFEMRQFSWDNPTKRQRSVRSYSKTADFFVLWGVDEDRFWIVPTTHTRSAMWVGRQPMKNAAIHNERRCRWADYENKWDLLDLNKALEQVESNVAAPHSAKETV